MWWIRELTNASADWLKFKIMLIKWIYPRAPVLSEMTYNVPSGRMSNGHCY